MTTNKFRMIALAALLFFAMLTFAAAFLPSVSGASAPTSGIADDRPDVYTVRSFGDKIGIFVPDSDIPIKTISVNPASLPSEAQLLLSNGITVNGNEELLLLIEDYIS